MNEQPLKITKLKVGLTVFVGLIIFFILITLVGTDEFYFSKTYNLYMTVDNVAGLVKGAPVTLGGFKIGSVDAIELVPAGNSKNIRLKLRLLKKYQNQITTGSFAEVTGIGILGDKFIDINIGKPGEQPLAEDTFIRVAGGKTLDEISKNLTPAIQDINKILSNLRVITDSVAAGNGTVASLINKPNTINEFSAAVNKITSVLNAIESDKGTIGSLLKDKQIYTELNESSKNLKEILAEIKSGKGTLGKLVANDSLYNNVNSAVTGVKQLIAQANNDSTVVNGIMKDKKLYSDMTKLIKDMNTLILDLKEHPDKYVKLSIF
jgi:phospholipid/cholesterol/gamma-HCH transport system substrate-binding protein